MADDTDAEIAPTANFGNTDVINCDNVNTYDLTTHDVVIATSAAIARLEEVYA